MELKDSKTYQNLAKSYAGECQAYVRYKFIEYGARMQGYKTMAELIDEVAFNEFNHARMFYTALQDGNKMQIDNIDISSGYPFKEKWDLTDNLRLAAEDEEIEQTKVYPEYMKVAKAEGFKDIAKLYEQIISVEQSHKRLFTELYNQMKNGTLYKKQNKVKWKCADCGYESEGKAAWKECPLCKAKQGSVLIKLDAN